MSIAVSLDPLTIESRAFRALGNVPLGVGASVDIDGREWHALTPLIWPPRCACCGVSDSLGSVRVKGRDYSYKADGSRLRVKEVDERRGVVRSTLGALGVPEELLRDFGRLDPRHPSYTLPSGIRLLVETGDRLRILWSYYTVEVPYCQPCIGHLTGGRTAALNRGLVAVLGWFGAGREALPNEERTTTDTTTCTSPKNPAVELNFFSAARSFVVAFSNKEYGEAFAASNPKSKVVPVFATGLAAGLTWPREGSK
ncbi:MAG: hypothetical protein ABSF46_25340 [Terriglobia bacterium]|jgi:hypothetical protein